MMDDRAAEGNRIVAEMGKDKSLMNTIFSSDIFKSIFDALPLPVFILDGDVRVHDFNAAAAEFLFRHLTQFGGLSYPVQTDLATDGKPKMKWYSLFCRDSFIAKAVKEAVQGRSVVRRYTKLEAHREGYRGKLETRINCCPFQNGARTQVLLVFEEMRQRGDRKGVIKVCCVCHRIINEKQALARLDAYAKDCTGVEFSHGLCPQCYQVEMAKVNAYSFGEPPIRLVENDDRVGNDMHRNCR
jgi:hypothetical protein